MCRFIPEIFDMTGLAQSRGGVLHDQKFAVAIIVRIMAASALHLPGLIDFYRAGQGVWISQLTALRGQPRGVIERNGVVVGQVGTYQGFALRHGSYTVVHQDIAVSAKHAAERDGAVVAA